jgi:SAM-dependent methyltransferase
MPCRFMNVAFLNLPRGIGSGIAARVGATAEAALDLQTGGGEVLAEALGTLPAPPSTLAATEAWPPNVEIARRTLAPFGADVAEADVLGDLPFPPAGFDLVISRHPVAVRFDEVRRVLRPGGSYLAQHVGAGSVRELTEFMMGPNAASAHPAPGPFTVFAGAAPAAAAAARRPPGSRSSTCAGKRCA